MDPMFSPIWMTRVQVTVHYTKYIKMCSFSFTVRQSATKTIVSNAWYTSFQVLCENQYKIITGQHTHSTKNLLIELCASLFTWSILGKLLHTFFSAKNLSAPIIDLQELYNSGSKLFQHLYVTTWWHRWQVLGSNLEYLNFRIVNLAQSIPFYITSNHVRITVFTVSAFTM